MAGTIDSVILTGSSDESDVITVSAGGLYTIKGEGTWGGGTVTMSSSLGGSVFADDKIVVMDATTYAGFRNVHLSGGMKLKFTLSGATDAALTIYVAN